MKKLKQVKGITLIALGITIIVLLILAGITINLTIGQGGILKMAEQSGENYINSADYEKEQLAELTNEMDDTIVGNRELDDTTTILNLTYADVFESYTEYAAPTTAVIIQKNSNIIKYSMYTGNGTTRTKVPTGTWTTIGVLKPEYRPITDIMDFGITEGNKSQSYWAISADGTVKVHQTSGSDKQCYGSFMYFTK